MKVYHFFSRLVTGTLEERIAVGRLQLVGCVEVPDANPASPESVAAILGGAADKLSEAGQLAGRPVCAGDFLQFDSTGDLYEAGVRSADFDLVCRAWGVKAPVSSCAAVGR